MADRAQGLANLLLIEGALRRDDPEHQQIYVELMGDVTLYDEVRRRLAAVGYQLVQELGHLGARVAPDAQTGALPWNRMGVHSGHIRLIVYLWVQLVYREWTNLRRDLKTGAPGQAALFDTDDSPWISYKALVNDFGELSSKSHLVGLLRNLKRWRFIRYDERRDRIWADASLYIQVDRQRMEDFVIDLARRMGTEDPATAVKTIATGSQVATPTDEEES